MTATTSKKRTPGSHDVLLCIQTGTTVNDADRMKFSTGEFFVRPEERTRPSTTLPEAVSNTIEIAERCNLELNLSEMQFPKFPVPPGETLDSFLENPPTKAGKTGWPRGRPSTSPPWQSSTTASA